MEEPEESIDGDSYGFDNCVERYTKPHPVNQNYAAADVTNLEKDLNHVASIRYRLGIDHWGKFVIRFLNEVMVDRYYGFIRLYIDIGKNSYSNIFRKFDLYIVGLHDGINLYELGLIKELKEGERLNRWIDTAYLTDYKESYKDLLGRSDLTGTKLSFQVLRNAARQVINNPGKPNEWKQNFAIFALLVSESARFVWLFVVLWFKMDTYRSMNLDGQYDWGAWLPHNWITLADCSLRTTIPATKPQHEPYTLAGAEELLLYPKLAEGALGARPWHGPHPPEGKGGPGDGGSGLKRAFARDRAKGPGVGGIRRRSRRRQRRYHGPHPPEGDGEDGDDRGGELDVSKATSKQINASMFPTMIQSPSGDTFFLLSEPDSAGSPPRRAPPAVETNNNGHGDRLNSEASVSGHAFGDNHSYAVPSSSKSAKKTDALSLGLPALRTGLSDDDLRESAYEVLLSSVAFSGIGINSLENPKKDKGSRFLSGLKNRRDKKHTRSHSVGNQFEQIDTIRAQMQVSEAMDERIRQTLMQFSVRKPHVQVDIPQIAIELLSGIQQNDFLIERSYTHWRKRQTNVLEELFSSVNYPEMQELGILLDKIRNPEEWNIIMTPAERAEVLLAIRQVASSLSSMGSSNIQGSSYWNAGYHLNIRLYERLLFGVFDILDEGQLIEEHADYLKLVKLTWGTLGITPKMHDALYGWVLFQQFVETKEMPLLDQANLQVQKVLSTNYKEGNEEQFTYTIMCTNTDNGTEIRLSLVQAIFRSINLWCDTRLQDYHLHFSEKPVFFRRLVSLGLVVGRHNTATFNEVKVKSSDASVDAAAVRVRFYVKRSLEAALQRVEDTINLISKMEGKHPLALLASELRKIAERELSVFSPVLCQWCPDAGIFASVHLHQYYGERLKPFLDDISFSEDAISVLSAAHLLEHYLIRASNSINEENGVGSLSIQEFDFYQIHKISRPIILDWLISQNDRILEWTGRAFHLEVWEPLSNQQKQAPSVVEVFRIVEETVDQLFKLSLPMDISHLQALLSIIFHALDGYLHKLVSQLVEKNHLYPAAPPLTRYKETIFPIAKKKVVENLLLDEEVDEKLKGLTAVKLCVRLNTLQYLQKQIDILEDGIKKSWASAMVSGDSRESKIPPGTTDGMLTDSESVDELFVATFDSIRDSVADAIRNICDLIGTRIIFWDLRDSFLFRLYHGSVEGARLENLFPQIDSVLNHVCGLIDDTLRDMMVASVCRAALEGYVWVLLDGGPACAFSDSDITLMEEDLNILKDLFIADGEGLPRSLVEVESKFAHQILSLFSLDADSLIHMLMMASENLSTGFGSGTRGQRSLDDANTLIRVLCHKKDKEASKFLKLNYHLPPSSDYVDPPSYVSTPK